MAADRLARRRTAGIPRAVPSRDQSAGEAEAEARFPRDVFTMLGQAGLLSLPFPEEQGGAGQPYEVYLQVVEEIARAWMSVAVGVSVHSLTCFPLATRGTPEQQERWLTGMLSGDQLGAYCLSEAGSGSDAFAMSTRAVEDGEPGVGTMGPAVRHGPVDLDDRTGRRLGEDVVQRGDASPVGVLGAGRGGVLGSTDRIHRAGCGCPHPARKWSEHFGTMYR